MWGIREPLVVRDALASGQRLPHPLEVEGECVIWFAVPTLSKLYPTAGKTQYMTVISPSVVSTLKPQQIGYVPVSRPGDDFAT